MTHLLLLLPFALMMPPIVHATEPTGLTVNRMGEYTPKPSQDLTWAHGDWVATSEHPTHGKIAEWKVKISPNGRFNAEVRRTASTGIEVESGVWVSMGREIWSFTTLQKDRKNLTAPLHDLYNILVISQEALELRHMTNGKVLRLERGAI